VLSTPLAVTAVEARDGTSGLCLPSALCLLSALCPLLSAVCALLFAVCSPVSALCSLLSAHLLTLSLTRPHKHFSPPPPPPSAAFASVERYIKNLLAGGPKILLAYGAGGAVSREREICPAWWKVGGCVCVCVCVFVSVCLASCSISDTLG
jgi:hypothetical protein